MKAMIRTPKTMRNATILPPDQAYVDTPNYNISNGHTIAGMNDIVPIESNGRNISIASEYVFRWIAGACTKEVMSHSRGVDQYVDVEAPLP